MMKWFWPMLTWTAGLTALALWFGMPRLEADLSERLSGNLRDYAWASFDIDGRTVQIKGMAPDPESKAKALAAVAQTNGIGDVSDMIAVLPLASPFTFKIIKGEQELLLSGFVPSNQSRDVIVQAAEATVSELEIVDEMALARGSDAEFEASSLFLVEISRRMKNADLALSDRKLVIAGKAASQTDYEYLNAAFAAALPNQLQAEAVNIAEP